ncbi:MAG: sulfite exporter TauE/SafE family protein [Proteobacteria bacterium]|nr:sulfite exporter TauE/SafE family protein [Pseudomonadota bacterium]
MNLDAAVVAAIVAIFVLAGFVKGVVGLGLPTVAVALLTLTIGVKDAMALMLVPSFVTNLWQAVAGGRLGAILARFWSLLAAVCLGVWLGTAVLATADPRLLTGALGVLLALYAGWGLVAPRVPSPARHQRWLAPLTGLLNGLVTGLTGTFVVPAGLYFQALGLQRDLLVQTMGVLFCVSTAALGAAMAGRGMMDTELGLTSLAGLVPALAGMWAGQKLRRRLDEGTFRRVFLLALLLLGLWLVGRALT